MKIRQALVIPLAALAGLALAETRSVTVSLDNPSGQPVPVSLDLLTVRNAIGADFPFDWADLRVLVDGESVPFQIDDTDLNGRVSAGDELAFITTGNAVIEVSDEPLEPVTFDSSFEVTTDGDATLISGGDIRVEIAPDGLARIAGFGAVDETLAAELGILRFSGFPESTWWADGQLGPHEEYTTLEAGGARHVLTEVLPAGPVRVTVVSEYASDRFVGLRQRVVTSVYVTGDVDVRNTATFGGYSDMMKLQHMATNVLSQADPEALHVVPAFRRLIWADQLDITSAEYFANRDALYETAADVVVAFNSNDNLSPLYWGAAYIFASAEPWRAGYSETLGLAVIESAYETPAIEEDYNAWLAGNTWVFESQEFRTGVFKWTADEFGTYAATEDITPSIANNYLPGTVIEFHYLYSVREVDDLEDVVSAATGLQAALASITLE